MARRHATTRRAKVTRAIRKNTKLQRAAAIIRGVTRGGARRSTTVHKAVRRAGISTRTYRNARKKMGTVAIRQSRRGGRRGRGVWYTSTRHR